MRTYILLLLFTINANAQQLTLNTNSSSIEWTGKAAFNAYTLTGTLEAESGTITMNNTTIESLIVTINMKSLDHENKDLKKHLRSKDFFEVNTYQTAVFTLTEPAKITNGKVVLKGSMTIKDVSHEELISASFNGSELTFEHTMDRTIYNVKFNSPSIFKKLKENAIADAFILKGSLKF